MVKLLKYEMKKQQTSRMVIGSILLVCVLDLHWECCWDGRSWQQ